MPDYRKSTLKNVLSAELDYIQKNIDPLVGLHGKSERDALVAQLVDSIRRVRCAQMYRESKITGEYANPNFHAFDPLRTAGSLLRGGEYEEACWLVFLSIHFGKSKEGGWRLVADVYRGIGGDVTWTWVNVRNNFAKFENWSRSLKYNTAGLTPIRKFGNHRKYQTLDYGKKISLVNVVASYLDVVESFGSHANWFSDRSNQVNADRFRLFDALYRDAGRVISFGRMAQFDLVAMFGKLNIVNVEPGMGYLKGATGPLVGGKLLFGGALSSTQLEEKFNMLYEHLSVKPFGMQVLEDAICNWQKSPSVYKRFRG